MNYPAMLYAICGHSNILDIVLARGGSELDRVGALCDCQRKRHWRIFPELDRSYRVRVRAAYVEHFNRDSK